MVKIGEYPKSVRPSWISSDVYTTPAEPEQWQIQRKENLDRAWDILQKVKPKLSLIYWDWYIIIDPESGVYFLDPTYIGASLRSQIYLPKTITCMYKLNDSGYPGRL